MTLREDRDRFAADNPERPWSCEGREWGVLRAGEAGPWLVLLPGTLGRADVFWRVIERVSGRARILSLSYPAEGTMADWAGDLAEIAEAHGVTDAVLLGSSLGGWLAQAASPARPDLFGTLVAANTLCDLTPLAGVGTYSQDLETMPDTQLSAGFSSGLMAMRDSDPRFAELAELLLSEVQGRIPPAQLRRRLIVLKEAPELPRPGEGGRVFTVESDDDQLIPPFARAKVRARLQPARAFRFSWGTHFPYITRPAEYAAIVEEALALGAPGAVWPAGDETVL